MTTDKTPATLPVDVLAVMKLALRYLNGGVDSLTGAEHFEAHGGMKEALAAVAELIEEGEKIEAFIHRVGMHCKPFSSALARVKGESA